MASPEQGFASRCSRTTRKPVTPKRLPLSADSVKASPDGGIAVVPSDGAYIRLTRGNILTHHGYAQSTAAAAAAAASRLPEPNESTTSPFRLANIGVRRADHGSALLQSPARAGHAARMRQIFEDAGRSHVSSQPGQTMLYPQLPNISRKASPTSQYDRDEDHPTRRPEPSCVSTSSFRMAQHKPQLSSPHLSEQSSESWSDDSGYFIAGSRRRTCSLGVPPRVRINDWLTNISEGEWKTPIVEDEIKAPSGTSSSPLPSPPKLTDIDFSFNEIPNQSPTSACDATTEDPFLDFDSHPHTPSLFKALPVPRRPPILSPPPARPNPPRGQSNPVTTVVIRSHPSPTKRSILEDGGIQLSPLSPNVCIERGPTRYRSARASPMKERQMSPCGENESGAIDVGRARQDDGDAEVQGSPLAPCKIGAGTRFQHPRHGGRGLGRFGRVLES